MKKNTKDHTKLNLQRILLVFMDIVLSNGCVYLSLVLRFTGLSSPENEVLYQMFLKRYAVSMIPYTLIMLTIFYFFKLYHSLWKYAGMSEVYKIAEACCVTEVAHISFSAMMGQMLPRSCYLVTCAFLILAVGMSRFMYRILRSFFAECGKKGQSNKIMIIGAGEAANVLIREIQDSKYLNRSKVICLIDDDLNKVGNYIRGIKIEGSRDKIQELAAKYEIDEIIFAIPTASADTRREILNICKETDCCLKTLPGVYQMINGDISIGDIRKVDALDLLGRDTVEIDNDSIMDSVRDKTVMVTGGGGSIGSELCRQIVCHNPKCLIIFDIYENNIYDIQQELQSKYPGANIVSLIGSVRSDSRLEYVFTKYRPEIVYHAAAHKHVPLMEDSPNEAIKNNVLGTWNLAELSDKYHIEKFVLISTDKAVNPTNVMGASKRICEMIIQSYNEKSQTNFVAVRFGNVLESNGSVIPLFEKQIKAGGPVTVTHPDIVRYFMTIPEAVSLVMQAGVYAKGGEIFVLDMGEPVKIDNLARNLIRLSGYTLGVDMEIKYTGLRPGEKLYEELLMEEEGLRSTQNRLIFVGKPIEFDKGSFFEGLERLKASSYAEDEDIRSLLQEIVPSYHPSSNETTMQSTMPS